LLFSFRQGVRYLIPVFIILVHYVLIGISKAPFSTIKKKYVLIFLAILGYLLPLRIVIVDFAKAKSSYVAEYGPTSKEAQECFSFIKKNTNENDVIVFHKPRVLGLYTHRKSFSNWHTFDNMKNISKDINQFSPKYILRTNELNNPALNIYIDNTKSLKIVFENEKYTLYKL